MEGSGTVRSSEWRVAALRWPGVAEASRWTLGVADLSGESLGSLDTCHHLDAGQILTTIGFFRQGILF